MTAPTMRLLLGDSLDVLKTLEGESVQCCVTSPPYWGLRDYGVDGQLGLEKTPDEYVARLVEIFREVRRVLKKDATCWINLGDSYAASGRGGGGGSFQNRDIGKKISRANHSRTPCTGYKKKDLVGIPWLTAFALREDGWFLRSDIIWSKPNPMPESVRDRPTRSHEYIFLLTRAGQYVYDAEAIKETSRYSGSPKPGRQAQTANTGLPPHSGSLGCAGIDGLKNRRSVWSVSSQPYGGAHSATYPPKLIRPCILAGSRPGDIVLDPFNGAGTTGLVALQLKRQYIGIDINAEYLDLTRARLAEVQQELFLRENA